MPTSTPGLEARSDPTLDCFTGAIILREGAGAVGSTYVRDSSTSPPQTTAPPSAPPSATPSATPTASCEPPPFAVRRTEFRAPSLVFVVRPGPATERARRRRALGAAATPKARLIRPRVPPWTSFRAFAAGAALAALAGAFVEKGGLAFAAFASLLAGTVTLAAALTAHPPKQARQASCRESR